MLISLIMQIAQSMQISIRHFLTPQTMHITFPLKNLAVKNISGLTHCRYSSGKWTTRRAGNSSRHYCRRAGSYRKQVERQATEERDRSQPPSRTYYRRCLRRGQASPNNTEVRQLPGQERGVCEEETAERFLMRT